MNIIIIIFQSITLTLSVPAILNNNAPNTQRLCIFIKNIRTFLKNENVYLYIQICLL